MLCSVHSVNQHTHINLHAALLETFILGSASAEVEPAFRDVEHLGSTRRPAWVSTYETPPDSANTFLHGAASYRLLWLVYLRCLSRTVSPAPDPSFLEGLVGGQLQHPHLLLLCL